MDSSQVINVPQHESGFCNQCKLFSEYIIKLNCGHYACSFCLVNWIWGQIEAGYSSENFGKVFPPFPCISGQPCFDSYSEELIEKIFGQDFASAKQILDDKSRFMDVQKFQ